MSHLAVVLCYHLTTGSLAETLIMWARQTDVTAVYSYKSLEGYTSPAFEGCTNPLALLDQLLMPAQWTYVVTSPTSVAIEPMPVERASTDSSAVASRHREPRVSTTANCICGAQVDRRNAAEWQHWCFVDGDITQLRWAPTCEAVP